MSKKENVNKEQQEPGWQEKLETKAEELKDKAEELWDKVEDRAGDAWDEFKEEAGELKDKAEKLWNKIVDKFDGDDQSKPEDKKDSATPPTS